MHKPPLGHGASVGNLVSLCFYNDFLLTVRQSVARALPALDRDAAGYKRPRYGVLRQLARNLLIPLDCADKLAFPLQLLVSCELADTESGLMTSHCPQTDVFSCAWQRVGAVLSVFWHRGGAL